MRYWRWTLLIGSICIGVLAPSSALWWLGSVAAGAPLPAPALAAPAPTTPPQRQADGAPAITVDDKVFASMTDYFSSPYFRQTGKRCGVVSTAATRPLFATPDDCTLARTVIRNTYWPQEVYVIPVVFHIIYASDGTGNLPAHRIEEQMQVLNTDYQALTRALEGDAANTHIYFQLAGVTRTMNDAWFADENEVAYKQALGWDPARFLNIYVNSAGGYLGYATLPQDTSTGIRDGVVVLYSVVGGRNLPDAAMYDQGRTLVHEVGHYLGLLHTFEGYGCFEGYIAGDLIADTASESEEHYGCTQTYTCGTPDDIHNFMNYTDDLCMWRFTREQANRVVCSLIHYRPRLYKVAAVAVAQQRPPAPVQAGARLTYTLYVTNTGEVELPVHIVNTLTAPDVAAQFSDDTTHARGTLAWSAVITAPGGIWTTTIVVTTPLSFTGVLTNVVTVTSTVGVTGAATTTVTVDEVGWLNFIPLIGRN